MRIQLARAAIMVLRYLAHDLVVGIHLSSKAYSMIRILSSQLDMSLTVGLRIANFNFQKALRDAIHFLNLGSACSCLCSRNGMMRGRWAYGLFAPADTGLVERAAASEWGHGRHRR
jgi:hypothetical protein